MSISEKYKGKYFFHFTHLDNLESILSNGLLSTNEKKNRSIEHLDVASSDIQCTRHEMVVPCGPKGNIHDYVPFYFCPRTPMFLSIIKSRNYDQPFFITFAVSFDKLKDAKFIFTNKAANRKFEPPAFYECPNQLDNLNWSIINDKSWRAKSEKHIKMAEALHYGNFDLSDVDYIVAWNINKKYVQKKFEEYEVKCPPIHDDGHNGYFHYYYDLNLLYSPKIPNILISSRGQYPLVFGPVLTRRVFHTTVNNIILLRRKNINHNKFHGIEEALCAIREDFSCIKELKDIIDLPTDNKVHKENVEKHTRRVVKNLVESSEYERLNEQEKLLVEFAAFLHDIGKGPKSRWPNGIQKVDDDHPRKSAMYIERILSQDILHISTEQIRQIILLVIYHDFFGDHLVSGRFLKEISAVLKTKSDLNMLYALAKADVTSIYEPWYSDRVSDWKKAYDEILVGLE